MNYCKRIVRRSSSTPLLADLISSRSSLVSVAVKVVIPALLSRLIAFSKSAIAFCCSLRRANICACLMVPVFANIMLKLYHVRRVYVKC